MKMPKTWTGDPARLAATHVPEDVAFTTKPGLAVDMIQRALAADVPFSWVAGDAVYGVGEIEGCLRRACKGFVLGVKSDRHFGFLRSPARRRRSPAISILNHGSVFPPVKAPKAHAFMTGPIADSPTSMPTNTTRRHRGFLWIRGLLIRRNISDGDLAFFTTLCPAGTGIQTLVSVEGHRSAIEDSFETAKNELGHDHNETRSWHGWHRHVSLVMLAFAMMAVIRYRTNDATPQKRPWMPTIGN